MRIILAGYTPAQRKQVTHLKAKIAQLRNIRVKLSDRRSKLKEAQKSAPNKDVKRSVNRKLAEVREGLSDLSGKRKKLDEALKDVRKAAGYGGKRTTQPAPKPPAKKPDNAKQDAGRDAGRQAGKALMQKLRAR